MIELIENADNRRGELFDMVNGVAIVAPGSGVSSAGLITGFTYRRQGLVFTDIYVDMTGLVSVGTSGRIIGDDSSIEPAYITQVTEDWGTPININMLCLESLVGGSVDIDVYSATEATGAPATASSALTEAQVINGGDQTAGTLSFSTLNTTPNLGDYLYLVERTATAAAYTAGLIKIQVIGTP